MTHTALILGGGVGGIVVANELRKRAQSGDRIILVERNPIHVFAPSLLWVATGTREADRIQRPLQKLLRSGIEVIQATVTSLDPGARAATVNGNQIAADEIVIALGADLAPDAIPGLAEGGHNFYTLTGAQALYTALRSLDAGKVVVLTAQPGYKCPAAPYEQALLIRDMVRRRGIQSKVSVEVHAAEPAPMGVAGRAIGEAVKGMLHEHDIAYFPNKQVAAVDAHARTINFTDGASTTYDVLAFVPPHRAPQVVRDAGLTGEPGWVPVDRATLQTRFDGVYAIGDVTLIPLAIGKPLPKAGVFAHAQGKIVAENIAKRWASSTANARFDGHGACFVEIGGSRAALGAGNFYAEPAPTIALRQPSILWHIAKVLLEKRWLRQLPFS
jgi:sulfide:quinone oxidoreductase